MSISTDFAGVSWSGTWDVGALQATVVNSTLRRHPLKKLSRHIQQKVMMSGGSSMAATVVEAGTVVIPSGGNDDDAYWWLRRRRTT
jgi:hypothetical protein